MSIINFIPSVWAGAILRALDTVLVYAGAGVINTDYEGEISAAGDSVRITMLGDVTVKTYTRDVDIANPDTLTDAQLTLRVDQQKYFNFAIDDIDKRQASGNLMDEAARRAAYGLRKVIDSFIAAMYTDIDVTTQAIGTDGAPDTGFVAAPAKAYERLIDLKVLLDNTDTPDDERFVVVPSWFEGFLLKDQRFVAYGTVANRQALESGKIGGPTGPNGLVGHAAGFAVYRSNQVPNTALARYKIIAGHKFAWSRATQILETEAYRPEKRFADALKGLTVYGAKVVRPSNLALLTANNA